MSEEEKTKVQMMVNEWLEGLGDVGDGLEGVGEVENEGEVKYTRDGHGVRKCENVGLS